MIFNVSNICKILDPSFSPLGNLLEFVFPCITTIFGTSSFSAAKCYDIEVWSPAEEKYLEVSSCSNFESFQARRGNIKYKNKNTKNLDFVNNIN